jgi:hypothetical protein
MKKILMCGVPHVSGERGKEKVKKGQKGPYKNIRPPVCLQVGLGRPQTYIMAWFKQGEIVMPLA